MGPKTHTQAEDPLQQTAIPGMYPPEIKAIAQANPLNRLLHGKECDAERLVLMGKVSPGLHVKSLDEKQMLLLELANLPASHALKGSLISPSPKDSSGKMRHQKRMDQAMHFSAL